MAKPRTDNGRIHKVSRASEVQKGCDAIPDLVAACHCDDCPNRPTGEGREILQDAVSCLEGCFEFRQGDTVVARANMQIDDAVDLIEGLLSLDCEACANCTEFTSNRCETCGGLAGERHALARIFPGTDEEPIYYEGCPDCLIYVANGETPDDEKNAELKHSSSVE